MQSGFLDVFWHKMDALEEDKVRDVFRVFFYSGSTCAQGPLCCVFLNSDKYLAK